MRAALKAGTPPEERKYLPDDRKSPEFFTYVDLFERWETVLQFIVRGFDQGPK